MCKGSATRMEGLAKDRRGRVGVGEGWKGERETLCGCLALEG
jgi:hypothetical protein